MATKITLLPATSAQRNQFLAVDMIRQRALERLYERREAVRNLICAIEAYRESTQARLAQCLDFPSTRTSPSSFSQSRI